MSNHKLLVGASIPVGLQAVKDFEAMKLGEIVLMTLPDDKAAAKEVMAYCRTKKIHVMLSELEHRGSMKERWHCQSLSKADFDEAVAEAGEFYLGRYTIGEAGGIMYWPKEYTIGRAVGNYDNLPPADDVIDAQNKYVAYLKKYIDWERDKVGNGRLLNVDSSMLFKYQAAAGLDDLCLEMLPGDPLRMLPAIRGCARMLDKFWGVHIAFGCYGGFVFDELWMKRWRQSLYLSYMAGSEFIFPESGYYSFAYSGNNFTFNSDKMRDARRQLREFFRFHKIHKRPGNSPRTPLALAFGQFDGCPGLWNTYAWGQYQNGDQWKDSDAERSWNLTAVLTTRENPYSELYLGQNSFSGNPPAGQYDILPAEASDEILAKYSNIVFLGYNLMDETLYNKLVKYVRNGGKLLMWLPHCNCDPKRGAKVKLFNGGDLSELFGVKVTGSKPSSVVGVKTIGTGTLPLPCRGIRRDPVMMGDIAGATVEIVSKDAVVCAGFTGTHDVTMEALEESPALIEHSLGKGKARLVPSFDYPAAPGMRPWADHLLRAISLDAQENLRLICADSVRYAVYDAGDYQVLYALNTEFDVSQNVRIWKDGAISGEFNIAPSTMGVFFVRGTTIIHPEHPETDVESWALEDCRERIFLTSLFEQQLYVCNLGKRENTLGINNSTIVLAPEDKGILKCQKRIAHGMEEFFKEDYLEEPWLDVKDTRLPY